jgi:hypothetical protein
MKRYRPEQIVEKLRQADVEFGKGLSVPAIGRENSMSNPILDDLLTRRQSLSVCWLGNLSWLIAWDDRLIAFDLDLDSPERLAPPPVSAQGLVKWSTDFVCREKA